jgi:hypothetical protein
MMTFPSCTARTAWKGIVISPVPSTFTTSKGWGLARMSRTAPKLVPPSSMKTWSPKRTSVTLEVDMAATEASRSFSGPVRSTPQQ